MKHFTNTQEVEFVFGRTLTFKQREMIQTFIDTEARPQTSNCVFCDEQDMRILTSLMDLYEDDVDAGRREWPWVTSSLVSTQE